MLAVALFLVAGSIVAMVALVAAVAGVATVTTQKLHEAFGGGTPKDRDLQQSLADWREQLRSERASLMRLRRGELDLLGQLPRVDKARRRSRVTGGTLRSIYDEPVALFRRRDYPKAKIPQALTIVLTANNEYTYRQRGDETLVTVDGEAFGALRQNRLYPPGKVEALATVERQTDGRTVHIDHGDHTIGILLLPGASRLAAPRAFEFVDCDTDGERVLLEVLGFHFLLTENLPHA